MKKTLTTFLAGVLVGTIIPASFAITSIFTDVASSDWYGPAVSNLKDKGIFTGYPDGSFGPDNYVNRAELAATLDRLIAYLDEEEPPAEDPVGQDEVPTLITSLNVPTGNDAFSFGNEFSGNVAETNGDVLLIPVGYGGGCVTHDFDLYWEGSFMETDTIEVDLHVFHDNKGDLCEAYLGNTLQFDISPLKEAFLTAYPNAERKIILRFFGSGDNSNINSIAYLF